MYVRKKIILKKKVNTYCRVLVKTFYNFMHLLFIIDLIVTKNLLNNSKQSKTKFYCAKINY